MGMTHSQPSTELLERQVLLEKLFNKNQLHDRIRSEFLKEQDIIDHICDNGIPLEFGIDLLTQMNLYRRTDVPTLVGVMRRHLGDSQATADMLYKCVEADLLDYEPNTRQFIVIFTITDDVQEELDRFQFPLPMVIPPREVRNGKDTGYVMGIGSVVLNSGSPREDVCLDHINRMNSIPFSIDMDTATMVKNQWRDLDRQKEGETRSDLEKRQKAFEKYDRTAKDVMDLLTEHGNIHYVTHRYDKRGRTYCMGYHVNYQGTPWNKAVIELAEKELVE